MQIHHNTSLLFPPASLRSAVDQTCMPNKQNRIVHATKFIFISYAETITFLQDLHVVTNKTNTLSLPAQPTLRIIMLTGMNYCLKTKQKKFPSLRQRPKHLYGERTADCSCVPVKGFS